MGAIHALGTKLVADEDTEFVLTQTAEPRGFDAQLGKAHGNVALCPGGADPIAVDIAKGTLCIGGKGCHCLSDGDYLRH